MLIKMGEMLVWYMAAYIGIVREVRGVSLDNTNELERSYSPTRTETNIRTEAQRKQHKVMRSA